MRRLFQLAVILGVCWFAEYVAHGAEIPDHVTAGSELSIPTSGSGDATFYLVGPGTAQKQTVHLGQEIKLKAGDLANAGLYTAVINGNATSFWVVPGKPADVAFLARPSRVPAARPGAITGTVFVFDANHNLVPEPTPVKFDLAVAGGKQESQTAQAKNGVAYIKMDSGRQAGAAQFVASVGDASVRRVVQEVAADPCNLRMHAQPNKNGVVVETDPIRDCAGNPVPDGTIVTFTAVDANGRSTVDARIKKGVARAEIPQLQAGTISVAAGVVMGNEIRWGGGR